MYRGEGVCSVPKHLNRLKYNHTEQIWCGKDRQAFEKDKKGRDDKQSPCSQSRLQSGKDEGNQKFAAGHYKYDVAQVSIIPAMQRNYIDEKSNIHAVSDER